MKLRSARSSLLLPALATLVSAQAPARPQPYCIRGVSLERGAEGRRATLLLRNGAIEAILDEAAPVPPGTRVVEGQGLLCLPAFLDAFTRQGCTVPQPVKDQDVPPDEGADVGIDMRLANRKGIQPAFRAVEALAVSREQSELWRKSGFGAALVSPGGELLSGSSVLVSTREAAMRDVVLRPDVFTHAAFTATGPGYPSTLMGYTAQLRQFLTDSARHEELVRRQEHGRPGLRAPFDAELHAGAALVSGQRSLLCEAQSASDIERWWRLADEFGLSLAISGGLEAWRVAEALVRREAAVVLTLDWGKEVKDPRPKEPPGPEESAAPAETGETGEQPEEQAPEADPAGEPERAPEEPAGTGELQAAGEEPARGEEPAGPVWEYEEPFEVRLERRTEWEQGRDSALRLREAGVRFAFGSASRKPEELLENVRTLVKEGLPAEAALAALTTDAAELLGVSNRLGKIAPGHDATLTLWRADPLTDEKAEPAWIFVDGFPTEFREEEKAGPDEGIDPSGTWELEFEAREQGLGTGTLVLEMEKDGEVTGKLVVQSPIDGSTVESPVEGRVSGKELELAVTLRFGEFRITGEITAGIEKEELDGRGSFRVPGSDEPEIQSFRGTRKPKSD